MASAHFMNTLLCLLALLPPFLGQKCGLVDLNPRSIVLTGNITAQSEQQHRSVIVVRVGELIYGDAANLAKEITLAQADKGNACGRAHKVGDQRIFIVESRPGLDKFVLTNSLPLSLKHLAENARRGSAHEKTMLRMFETDLSAPKFNLKTSEHCSIDPHAISIDKGNENKCT